MGSAPQKDCHNCRRRRIKCDRTTPTCEKCASRSLECPGYGIDIKWKQEPGIRRSIQHDDSTPGESSSSSVCTPATAAHRHQDGPEYKVGASLAQLRESDDPFPRRLLQHYERTIAPRLVCGDSPNNVYRTSILPISATKPAVKCALLALAAGDLSTRLNQLPQDVVLASRAKDSYQNEALTFIASDIKRLSDEAERFIMSDPDQARTMLLSVFLLVMMGIRTGEDHLYRLHMRTADALMQTWFSTLGAGSLLTSRFETTLIHDLCDAQIWCSITTADVVNDRRLGLQHGANGGSTTMGAFVRTLHRITAQQQSGRQHSAGQLHSLLASLNDARWQALRYCSSLASPVHKAFDHLFEIIYQASLIYLYRACLAPGPAEAAVILPRRTLFETLRGMNHLHPVAHHLAWPLFIAGTECRNFSRDKAFVQQKFNEIMEVSGILCRRRIIAFLQELWSRDQSSSSEKPDWIVLAQEWAQRGVPIMIF